MNRMERFHAFHLNEDPARDNEIGSMLSYHAAFVRHRNTNLPSVRKTSVIEFDTQCFLVGPFE